MFARSFVKRVTRGVGLEITRFPAPNTLGWQIQLVLRERSIGGVIDVGAHEGGFCRLLREVVRYRGPIVSFEPSSASFALLKASMTGDSNWRGLQLALGALSGSQDLNVFAGSDLNSLLAPSQLGRTRFDGMKRVAIERVEVRRLDQIEGLPPGDLILKTDTQGLDMEVIAGASGILHRVEVLVVELNVRSIYEGAPALPEVIMALNAHGLELAGLFPVTRDTDRLRVMTFDGVFIKV